MWSIILVLFTQDLPYLILRIVILAKGAGFVVHTLLFFTLKNAFMIFVDIYKLRTIYQEYSEIKLKLSEYAKNNSLNSKKILNDIDRDRSKKSSVILMK